MKLHPSVPPTEFVVAESPSSDPRQPRSLLSVADVCAALQCGRTFVYELLQRGDLRPIKLGRLTRISSTELDTFLAGKEADAAERFGPRAAGVTEFGPGVTRSHVYVRDRRKARVSSEAGTASSPAVEQQLLLDAED
ncbi:MAG: helix-turn-helix domain-containing protein [Candidatus Dormibacter sp.]